MTKWIRPIGMILGAMLIGALIVEGYYQYRFAGAPESTWIGSPAWLGYILPRHIRIGAAILAVILMIWQRDLLVTEKSKTESVQPKPKIKITIPDMASLAVLYAVAAALTSPLIQLLDGASRRGNTSSLSIITTTLMIVIPIWLWIRFLSVLAENDIQTALKRFCYLSLYLPLVVLTWGGLGVCTFQCFVLGLTKVSHYLVGPSWIYGKPMYFFHDTHAFHSNGLIAIYGTSAVLCLLGCWALKRFRDWCLTKDHRQESMIEFDA